MSKLGCNVQLVYVMDKEEMKGRLAANTFRRELLMMFLSTMGVVGK